MASPDGQFRVRTTPTRERLLDAAAQLIAETGWGRVTTRGIAQRAGLPHGTVSYHFAGKQALLVEAALRTARDLFPSDGPAEVRSLDGLLDEVAAAVSGPGSADAVGAGVLVEAMRESARDPELRRGLAGILGTYREHVAGLARATPWLRRRSISPDAAATLLVAFCDGLWVHALLDSTLDAAGAVEALKSLLTDAPTAAAP